MAIFHKEYLELEISNIIESGRLINNVGDREWFVLDELKDDLFSITWNNDLRDDQVEWSQRVLLNLWGYADSDQTLVARKSTYSATKNIMCRILKIAMNNDRLKNLPLAAWTFDDVCSLIRVIAKKDDAIIKDDDFLPGLYASGEVEKAITLLRNTNNFYEQGQLDDGLSMQLPAGTQKIAVTPLLEEMGYEYDDWLKGRGWQSVPIEVAMIFVADALELFNSEKTKIAVAYYDFQREAEGATNWIVFRSGTFNELLAVDFDKRKLLSKQASKNQPSRKSQATIDVCKDLSHRIEQSTGRHIKKFPFKSQGELNKYCSQVYDAFVTLMLCMTGIRISELASIRTSWFKKDSRGAWMFKSKIIKTDYGLMTIRGLSGVVAEAADIIRRLSYVDKDKTNLKLMARTYEGTFYKVAVGKVREMEENGHCNLTVMPQSQAHALKRDYKELVARYGHEARMPGDKIHPHMFRHTFAEFALRRFDDDVIEAIRHHYRHAWGSYMTRKYTDKKLRLEEQRELELDYIADLVSRIDTDSAEFSGPIALYIKKRIQKSHKVLSPVEANETLKDITEEFESVTPHEWGYCLVRTDTKSKSNCYNENTKTPEVDSRSSFETCSGCRHRLTHKSQKEDIIRIGIAHQEHVDNYPLPAVTQHSKAIVKTCESLLKAIEAGI